ncbi:MAG TPA: NAD(P)/FAD-dependent oxidoreductase [Nitrososphaeraceae archaeon]|nr:NAD(P)/FAD-dependent oxidoreductase [Nitrososphaeraceae archaeon]
MNSKATEIRVDFSLKREVFFVVIGAMLGAVSMLIPTAFEVGMGLPYYVTWVAFGHVVGVYSSNAALAGIAIHTITAISIGIVIGVFLYKTGILNISKLSNGLLYGLFAGSVILIIFFIPVYMLILHPDINHILTRAFPRSYDEYGTALSLQNKQNQKESDETYDEYGTTLSQYSFPLVIVSYIIMHLVFGIIVGLTSSTLSIKFGSRYRCTICDISFSRIDSYQKHVELIHGQKPIQLKRILILGGGFAGIEVLRLLQKAFQNDIKIDITLVSRDNFFLFTPMLPEISSGMIETRHIVTPLRAFCNRAKFYESEIESIDLENKKVVITHRIGKHTNPIEWRSHILKYDYLVIALGSETNFFGISEAAKQAFTLKSLGDAIVLRNHVLNMLEQADIEHEDLDLRKRLLTFVVVGGGFSGVEIVGELNDFILDSIKYFYHNLKKSYVRIILVNSGGRILPEVTEDLADFALQKIRRNGVEVILNTRVVNVTSDNVKLDEGTIITTQTIIWAGGGKPQTLVSDLACQHDKSGRIMANKYLEVAGYTGSVIALGDSSCVTDPNTGKPYPPTAQHALRQGKIAATNLISKIKGQENHKELFDYKTKGVMTLIGKRNGVGIILGHKVHGFVAWWFWRSYYLVNLPTVEKKLRVLVDWMIDLFFKRDVTRLKSPTEEIAFKPNIYDRSFTTISHVSRNSVID